MAPTAPTAPPHRQAPSAATCAAACSARGVAPLPLRRQLEASLTNGILAELEADASFALPPSWTAGFRAGARQIIAELSLPQLQTIARRYGPPPPALAGSAHRTPQLPAQGRPRTAPRPASPPLTPIPVIQVLPPDPPWRGSISSTWPCALQARFARPCVSPCARGPSALPRTTLGAISGPLSNASWRSKNVPRTGLSVARLCATSRPPRLNLPRRLQALMTAKISFSQHWAPRTRGSSPTYSRRVIGSRGTRGARTRRPISCFIAGHKKKGEGGVLPLGAPGPGPRGCEPCAPVNTFASRCGCPSDPLMTYLLA